MSCAIVFDYNGVIAHDEHLHEKAFAEALAPYDIPFTKSLYQSCCLGRTDSDGFLELRKALNDKLNEEPIENLVEGKQEAYKALVQTHDILYPHAADVIHELSKHFRLAIVSSSTRDEITTVLGKHGLVDCFPNIVTADDIVQGKPDPEGYTKSIRQLDIASNRAVAIEDSPSGVKAAKSAGLFCIAVLHTADAEYLSDADRVVGDITEIDVSLILDVLGDDKHIVSYGS